MKAKKTSGIETAPHTVERRSFIWKAGAALTGTVASAAAIGAAGRSPAAPVAADSKELDRLSNQLRLREDADEIRRLQQAFGSALNERRFEDLVRLFADNAQVHFNGEVFAGRARGIRSLYVEQFGRRGAAQRPEPVHACVVDSTHEPRIEVSADRQSATAQFPCITQVECAIEGGTPLVEMARQQGQGVLRWWEHGLYENAYVKRGGEWKILELRYSATGRADVTRPPILG